MKKGCEFSLKIYIFFSLRAALWILSNSRPGAFPGSGIHSSMWHLYRRIPLPLRFLAPSCSPEGDNWALFGANMRLEFNLAESAQSQTDTQGIFYMPHNHTTWTLSIFCTLKIGSLNRGSNPQTRDQKASA